MTQAGSRPALPLKLIAMQMPETVEWLGKSIRQEADNNVLLLIPGQTAEISLRMENTGNLALQWQLEILGDFPRSWCLWRREAVQEILPCDQVQERLCFHVPIDFFEQQDALSQTHPCLKLNYQSEICLYAVEGTSGTEERKHLVGYRSFQLWVRPDCTYLDFLPEIYQASDYMGRFLMLIEQAFDPTVEILDLLWAYLDPLTAPKAFLPFLSQWVAWSLNPRWTLKQQRRILRNAIKLYRWRGTRWGMLLYLHLYTGLPLQENYIPEELAAALSIREETTLESRKRISVVDSFKAGFIIGGEVQLGQGPIMGGGKPYHFVVTLRPDNADQIDEVLIRDIIEQVKPAFCSYDLSIVSFYQFA